MVDRRPLVSVVIPAYNLAGYLEEAVESVLAQDYPNVELIVLDDGSKDHTRKVLEKYTGRFYWETHPNMGQAATLNKGWRMSKGQVLAYLSADDVLLPHAVSTSVGHLLANPDVVLTYCDFDLIDPNSKFIRRVTLSDFDYRKLVLRTIRPPGPGAFFGREAFEAAGPWNPSYRQIPDLEFYLRLGLQGKFLRIPEVLASLRVHDESQSFMQADEARNEEFVRAISEYYELENVPPRVRESENEALANAHIMAARFHLRAGRYRAALVDFREAWHLYPRNVLSTSTVRVIANGLFNRVGHRIWWAMRSLGAEQGASRPLRALRRYLRRARS